MIDKIYTITNEAVVELQEKMKAWVRAVLPKNTSELENDSGYITGDDVPQATYVAIYGRTTFADIQSAISEGKCVKCDMTGYTYELVNELPTKITFAATNNVDGVVTQETVWVNSDNTWNNEGINLAKAVDVPTKTSDLNNDSGFTKVVFSDTPPAEGTPDDVLTVLLGNPGGGGESGSWEQICDATNVSKGNTYDLSEPADKYDIIAVVGYVHYTDGNTYYVSQCCPTSALAFDGKDYFQLSDETYKIVVGFKSKNSARVEYVTVYNNFKMYGMRLRGKQNVYSEDEVAIGKWVDGKTLYRRVTKASSGGQSKTWSDVVADETFVSSVDMVFRVKIYSTFTNGPYWAECISRKYSGKIQAFGTDVGWVVNDTLIVEYTKNEG